MQSSADSYRLPLIRNRYFLIADLLLIPIAAWASFLLRLDFAGLQPYLKTAMVFAVLAFLVKPPIFYLFGLYRHHWRYASTGELVLIALSALSGTAVVTLLVYSAASLVINFRPLPRSIPVLDFLVSLAFVGGIRFVVRLEADHPLTRMGLTGENGRHPIHRVLVMGAGDAGAMIVREMQANPGLGFVPVGLLDDDRAKVGLMIHNVPVQGSREDIPALVREQEIDQVMIAMPTAAGRDIRAIVAICQQVGVPCKTMPGIYELISGSVSVKQVRDVQIEDLLRRAPVRIEDTEARGYLKDAVVLVTGAGGSIGSELCRQIALCQPRKLLLLGHGENSIYHILMELRAKFPQLAVEPLIADIRDHDRLTAIFCRHKPEIVFHAAAHKHVPLMEYNVPEAVSNNVFGTLNLLKVSEACGVARFVMVSTDKAVSPTNVMGATKQLAEQLVREVAQRTGRAYVVVRFGNVLGSRGSVVPLFQRQIASGGPVTVTHPEMTRYFMTIPEAVQLILQAGVLGEGGEVFVLDMGEPVRVVDLATDLIRLSGLEPGRDIEIVFTGIRPGEKLTESLFTDSEESRATRHKKIFAASGEPSKESEVLRGYLAQLDSLVQAGDAARLLAKLQEGVVDCAPLRQAFYDDV